LEKQATYEKCKYGELEIKIISFLVERPAFLKAKKN